MEWNELSGILSFTYRIYFVIVQVLPFLNNLKDLDPSYKMDLDLWDCFGREKNLSYICLISLWDGALTVTVCGI